MLYYLEKVFVKGLSPLLKTKPRFNQDKPSKLISKLVRLNRVLPTLVLIGGFRAGLAGWNLGYPENPAFLCGFELG